MKRHQVVMPGAGPRIEALGNCAEVDVAPGSTSPEVATAREARFFAGFAPGCLVFAFATFDASAWECLVVLSADPRHADQAVEDALVGNVAKAVGDLKQHLMLLGIARDADHVVLT